jgi:hypothetical protein
MSRRPIDLGQQNPDCAAAWHGTRSAYRHGCRCPHAREDARIMRKRHRHGRAQPAYVDATGTARRIQALSALGWRFADIADRYGDISYQSVQKLALMSRPRVHRLTVDKVKAVYDELSMHRGPSEQTRRRAQRKGWKPPLAWDDDTIDDPKAKPERGDGTGAAVDPVAVHLALTGEPAKLVRNADKRAAVAALVHRNVSARDIAHRLRMSESAVDKAKQRHNLTHAKRAAA